MNQLGADAEQLAAHYLQQRGLKLLQTNYHSRYGEIDLIMQDGDTLVFVEVRLRNNPGFGGAAASVDARKQDKLIKTAQHYLCTLKKVPPCRFDVVALEGDTVNWLKSAFSL